MGFSFGAHGRGQGIPIGGNSGVVRSSCKPHTGKVNSKPVVYLRLPMLLYMSKGKPEASVQIKKESFEYGHTQLLAHTFLGTRPSNRSILPLRVSLVLLQLTNKKPSYELQSPLQSPFSFPLYLFLRCGGTNLPGPGVDPRLAGLSVLTGGASLRAGAPSRRILDMYLPGPSAGD